MSVAFDADGRDANGYRCCDVCRYPYSTPHCDNPACDANPSFSEATKAARRAAAAKRQAEQDRWEADRRLKQRAWDAYRNRSA